MAKRVNPYTDDYIPQSKTHVGLKEFNNNEDRLQKVYVKTLNLLYKGAKKSQPQDIINSGNNNMKSVGKNDKMKQLFIGTNGSLLRNGSMDFTQLLALHCSCGNKEESRCAYCEVSLCSSCQHVCSLCHLSHCATCTLFGFEGSDICVSCYS